MRHVDLAGQGEQIDPSNPGHWLALALVCGLFTLGLLVFRRKVTPRGWIGRSPAFQRIFPKVWGGLVMTVTGTAVVGMLLSSLGLHPTGR
ncbi:hypothetical protein ACFV0O_31625 [Kitasatospora sp. NPDC059577]|uniref:hypothetical protein n=1 Tax=unclassified Kitasatospora TaxID=2633591 RepID=UPI00368CC980